MFTIRISHMNLNQIANSGQCFRWKQIDQNTYKIPAFGKELTISQNDDLFILDCNDLEWVTIWRNYFDVDTETDYDEVENIIMNSNDEFLKTAYRFGSGIRILRQDRWETMVSFIISQNNNIPRIKKSIEMICDETNGKFPNCNELLNMNIFNKGLGYRDMYVKRAAEYWSETHGYELYYNNIAKKRLMMLKGIGNKVADCICLFGLHMLNSFPIDTHIKRIIDREYNGNLPEWAVGEYAGLFQQYIFYYELNH